ALNTESEILAEASSSLWARRQALSASGAESMPVRDQSVVILWQSSSDSLRALIAAPKFVETEWLSFARSVAGQQFVSFQIGGVTADHAAADGSGPIAKRTGKQTDLPWDVVVTGSTAASYAAAFSMRRK